MSPHGGYANPEDYANPEGSVLGGERRSIELRTLADKLRKAFIRAATALTSAGVARPLVFCVSMFMIIAPVVIFVRYLSNGTLLISPPLFLTFLGGFIGLALTKSEYWK